ncbi:acyl-coenzyme A thioesterase 13-like [Anthonomus grandis grandis]|uniref:acyl-coenzyme A thioesterase 13-like n=1 Tax=Anthonomus grandis grandis TaxID=2921223 RepID=UPI002165055B|nr:acyl-coenzyme A thioesterase 13-like [Anthonomus grandis grandis]XP_050306462.1 acyl-coenzyme A thioesterase 13-like [Anthonomus grandis grandis]XP_050306463.1 acyl-coenzyme A thioesterase 13-like [Anthonomus grandis grandis]
MVLTVAQLNKIFRAAKNFDRVLNKVTVTSLGNGKCTAEMKVEEEHSNALGGLHGGLSATLVDCISTYALVTHKYGAVPNVSVHINTEYLKGAKIGDEIEISADTLKVGKTLAFLEVLIKEKKTGALLVKGSHTKFLISPREK